MGMVITARQFATIDQSMVLKPIIFCCIVPNIEEHAISLNKMLADELVKYKPEQRTMQIARCFNRILGDRCNGVIIKDFDVLFRPDYKIDVLKILVNTCRYKPFSVIWPGKYKNKKLYYAEEGYLDYKIYDVDNYDVTCVIQQEE